VQQLEAELKRTLAVQSQLESTLILKSAQLKALSGQNEAQQEQVTVAKAEVLSQIEQLKQQLSAAQGDADCQIKDLQLQLTASCAETEAANARAEEWAQYNAATVAEYEAALTAKHEEHITMTSGLQIKLVAAQEAVASMAKSHTKGVTQTRAEHEASVQQLAKQLATQTDQHHDRTLEIAELQEQLTAVQAEAAAAISRVEEWVQINAATVADYEAALAAKQAEADENHRQGQAAFDAAAAKHAAELLAAVSDGAHTQHVECKKQNCDNAGLIDGELECKQQLQRVQCQLDEARVLAIQQSGELRIQRERLLEQSVAEVSALTDVLAKLHLLAEEQSMAAKRHADFTAEYAIAEARCSDNHNSHQFVLAELASKWIADGAAADCKLCGAEFTTFRRRHHCRKCGEVVCADCSSESANVVHSGVATKQKVCDTCFASLHEAGDADKAARDYKALLEAQAREQSATDERVAELIAQHEAVLAEHHAQARKRLGSLRLLQPAAV